MSVQISDDPPSGEVTGCSSSHAVVFLRDEGDGPFVPFYHGSSITLKEVQDEFHVSSVLECDQGGNVLPRAVAFDSPSDVLRSGRHYIAKRDLRSEEGASRVTFRSKILVKEYELDPLTATPKGPSFEPSKHRVGTPFPRLDERPAGKENAQSGTFLLPGGKRGREEVAEFRIGPNENAVRFIPFTADIDGSGQDTLVTMDVLRRICAEDRQAQEQLYQKRHEETEQLLANARRVLFVEDGE